MHRFSFQKTYRLGLMAAAISMVGCGGGDGTSEHATPSVVVNLPDFVIDQHTQGNALVQNLGAFPAHINPSQSNMVFRAELLLKDYLAVNRYGHFAIVLRCDPGVIREKVLGQGYIGGYLYDRDATSYLETWFNTYEVGDYLDNIVFHEQRAPDGSLKDHVRYQLTVESLVEEPNRYLRFAITDQAGFHFDTGYVADPNKVFNPAHNCLTVGHVFETSLQGWSIEFSNPTLEYIPRD
ncbi:hypothetical protein SAMN02745117_00697 [Lampropedia hyalina DSM 16112]|jgi:hypothetical protein|uniref:Uncharacterized protein n=1 Tax=Lampropedia hyalina DSM 16112 TaxID=1122156 RepID=A0A1M4VPY9_9BURK|nr:hypothetical protein [Lampropedia hyalina]SHE71029.1 hypothetical protein SAMN02745117_00697 [Lampropedia hyalina DSM 16112]